MEHTNDQQNNILQVNEESQEDFFSHYVNLKINNNLLKGVEVFDLLSDSDDSVFYENNDDLTDEY